MRERGGIVGVGAQPHFRAVAVAVQVGVLVEAEERHRPRHGCCVLEPLAAIAQAVGVDVPPIGRGQGMFAPHALVGWSVGCARRLAPGRRVAAIFRRPDGDQCAVRVGLMREVARQHIQHRLLSPGRNDIGVDGLVAVIRAVLDGDGDAGVGRILVEQLVDAVGEVLGHDADRAAQVDRLHLLQGQRDVG